MQLNATVVARGLVKHWNYFSHHIIAQTEIVWFKQLRQAVFRTRIDG